MKLSLISGFFLLFITKSQCQLIDDIKMISLWKNATIENIDCQISFIKSDQDSSFYRNLLLGAKKFVVIQSISDGLREDFFKQVLKQSFDSSGLKNIYVIENYKSGEVFSAIVGLFIFDDKNKRYLYKLDLGKWKIVDSVKIVSDSIKYIYSNKSKYLCNKSYVDESIIISHFKANKITSKAFFFSCSADFKKIKQLLR